MAKAKLEGKTSDANTIGVSGESETHIGVKGVTHAPGFAAVYGLSENHTPQAGAGVMGKSDGVGVMGESSTWHGVAGLSSSTTGGAGVMGEGDPGPGVIGKSTKWVGVYGETEGIENGPAGVWGEHKGAGIGVKAISQDGKALFAASAGNEAIHAETQSSAVAAVAAFNKNPNGKGAAIYAEKAGDAGHAGFFIGNVHITRTLIVEGDIMLPNADCAEEFEVIDSELVEPGMVMVLGVDGVLQPCQSAYDRRVAGVISGAGAYKPGIVLDKQPSASSRQPIALMGKVYCKVDAGYGAIAAGDLLTSSDTPGHAMRADDPLKAFGAILGKALKPLTEGQGLIPILVSNQ